MQEITEISSMESPMSLSSLITALTTMRDSMGAPGNAPVLMRGGEDGGGLEQVEYTQHDDEAVIVLHGE